MPEFRLSAGQRRALDALCRRIVPAAHETDAADDGRAGLAAAAEARLAANDQVTARVMATLMTAFDSRVVAVLDGRAPRRFSARNGAEQDAILTAWERSGRALRRTVFQAFRRLVLSTYYALPEALAGVGHRGPLPRRAAEQAWEGPLAGDDADDGPV
ncbi:gluconate 2-dehydrogenase subunit 3 family protein, partial [Roseisolibacter sp. H3M3-2]|uniref:gluconate 2-dehydrogenase subunit 3 family protein n=1 Tax=Roseisolibacter sp. H3M3-2 TaxID=3031323 RepID=UPI0023DA2319